MSNPLSINIKQADTINIANAANLLRNGQLVAFATETVYGLGADATNARAVAEIFAVKGRPQFNPLIIHVNSPEMAKKYVAWNDWAEKLVSFMPGPLTLILPRLLESSLSLLASAGGDTVGIRIPAHRCALALLTQANIPLAAPSANRSGRISPTTAQAVYAELGCKIPLILDDGACSIGIESTVIDISGAAPVLLRPGFITKDELESFLHIPIAIAGKHTILKSPGLLESHYAPSLSVRLNAIQTEITEAFLAFGELPVGLHAKHSINLSITGDLTEAAARLFSALRLLDQPENYSAIAVMPIPDTGIGAAINDRLRRAACQKKG